MTDRTPPRLIDTLPFGIPIPELLVIIGGLIVFLTGTDPRSAGEIFALTLAISTTAGVVLCVPLSLGRLERIVPDLVVLAVGLAVVIWGFFFMGDTNIGGSALALLAIGVTVSATSHLLRRLLARWRQGPGDLPLP